MVSGRTRLINDPCAHAFLVRRAVEHPWQAAVQRLEGFNIILNLTIAVIYHVGFCNLSSPVPFAVLNAWQPLGPEWGFWSLQPL